VLKIRVLVLSGSPNPADRDGWTEDAVQWLTKAGYEPVQVDDTDHLARELNEVALVVIGNANPKTCLEQVPMSHRGKALVLDPTLGDYYRHRDLFKAGFLDVAAKPYGQKSKFLELIAESLNLLSRRF